MGRLEGSLSYGSPTSCALNNIGCVFDLPLTIFSYSNRLGLTNVGRNNTEICYISCIIGDMRGNAVAFCFSPPVLVFDK
jgi:hypothetical protein